MIHIPCPTLVRIGQFVSWTLSPPGLNEQSYDSHHLGVESTKKFKMNLPQLPAMESSMTEAEAGACVVRVGYVNLSSLLDMHYFPFFSRVHATL